jgi:hypothetical protein
LPANKLPGVILDQASNFLENRVWLVSLLLAALYLIALHRWHAKPLWYDELYTYYIAQAPSLHAMFRWIRQIDLNPPLYYLAVRLTFHILHPGALSVRLPSILAYFVAALSVLWFVRVRLGTLYGFLAAIIVLGSTYGNYAIEARPYAFMLAFTGLCAVSWQRANEETGFRRWLLLFVLTLSGFSLLLSHVLALVGYGVILFAEAVRSVMRRKPDWTMWTALAVPLCSCVLYLPLIRQHSAGIYPPAFQASILAIYNCYSELWLATGPCLAAAIVVVFLTGTQPVTRSRNHSATGVTSSELTLALGLLAVPLAIILEFMRSHAQFFSRYGICSLLGIAILVPVFLSSLTSNSPRVALLSCLIFSFGIIRPESIARNLQQKLAPNKSSGFVSLESRESIKNVDPTLPFVDADGLTFVAMNYYENPAFLSRVYFLIDPAAAYKYSHANGFNGMPNIEGKFPVSGHIESYEDFAKKHQKFLVLGTYDYPDDWLLRKLIADKADVRFLGEFQSDYKDHELYEVTLAH